MPERASEIKRQAGGLSLNMVHPMSPTPAAPLGGTQPRVAPLQHAPPNLHHHSARLGLPHQTYNSRRLSVWKSCQESVVSRLLDRFLRERQKKGELKGNSGPDGALGAGMAIAWGPA